MRDRETRVGIHGEQRRQRTEVDWRLQDPVHVAELSLQDLEHQTVGVVGRSHVAPLIPRDVRRHVIARGELLRAERERHRRQTFLVHPPAVHVDGVELAGDLPGEAQLTIGERNTRVRRVLQWVGAGRWHRSQQLPTLGDPRFGILREQCVEDGGAGTGRAGHEQGRVDLLVDDPGIVTHVRRELEPDLEEAQQEATRHPTPHQRELGLLFQCGQQHLEGFEKVVASEVGDAAVGHAERRSGLGEQVVAGEGELCDLGDGQHETVVDGADPLGPGWRLPGHPGAVSAPRRVRPSPRAGSGT